jgi:hypothetical protein
MNIWLIVYKGFNGKWMPSFDYFAKFATRKAARVYTKKFPGLLKDGTYRIVKFTAEIPK